MDKDTNKNFLNIKKLEERKEDKGLDPKIVKGEKETSIIFPNELLSQISRREFDHIVKVMTSPLFFPFKEISYNTYDSPKSSKIKIAFFMEQMGHYTGGRYYTYCLAVVLSKFADVTFITDKEIPFVEDFKGWFQEFETPPSLIIDERFGNNIKENEFDLAIGAPNVGGQAAISYSERFQIPCILLMFESPNYVSKYRGGIDSTEEFWSDYKKCLLRCNKIITISKTSKNYIREWLKDKRPDVKIDVVYPCINEILASSTAAWVKKTQRKGVILSTRMAPFKNPLPILRELGKMKFKEPIHLVGKIWSNTIKDIERVRDNYNLDIRMYSTISDIRKFEIMNKCKVMMFPSEFEGFGLPPLEALKCGLKVVAFDIPVLREVYGENIEYIEPRDYKGFAKKIIDLLELKEEEEESNYTLYRVLDLKDEIISSIDRVRKIPKLSVGMIAYNDEDYIEVALDSVYNSAYEIIIVEGGVKDYPGVRKDGSSDDDTVKIINKYMHKKDFIGKIRLVPPKSRPWKDKIEMQNQIASRVRGDIYMKCDTDEIWKEEDIQEVLQMYKDKELVVVTVPFLHFWTNFKTVAKDSRGKWSTHHPRFWRWIGKFRHSTTFNGFVDLNKDDRRVWEPNYKVSDAKEVICYHFGYVKPLEKINRKLKYYKGRKIEKVVIPDRYEKWRKLTDPTQPTQAGASWSEEIEIELPRVLMNHKYSKIKNVRDV